MLGTLLAYGKTSSIVNTTYCTDAMVLRLDAKQVCGIMSQGDQQANIPLAGRLVASLMLHLDYLSVAYRTRAIETIVPRFVHRRRILEVEARQVSLLMMLWNRPG